VSGTVKTVLIVGGAAVGAFVLFKALAPSSAPKYKAPRADTDLVTLSGLVGLGKGVFDSFGGSSGGSQSAAPAIIDTPSGFYLTPAEAKNVADYNAQAGTQYGIYGIDYGPGITS